jgi:hypothetical protein
MIHVCSIYYLQFCFSFYVSHCDDLNPESNHLILDYLMLLTGYLVILY